MKLFLSTVCAWLFLMNVYAQSNQYITYLDQERNWIKINNYDYNDPQVLLADLKPYIDLDPKSSLELIKHEKDQLGLNHYRYQQYHQGIKVEAAQFLLHFSNKGYATANGKLLSGIEASSIAQVSEEDALTIALDHVNAPMYYWEDSEMEALLKKIHQDPNATYYPIGELVFAEKDFSQNASKYQLYWRFEINSHGENPRLFVYVNANTGEIAFIMNGMHSDAVEGVANTRYYGERDIIADSVFTDSSKYILFDETRGNGIWTLNLNEETDSSNVTDFGDDDNYWNNFNEDWDEVAGDGHWGASMTYDYYMLHYGRDSFDDEGSMMVVGVHYGENIANAFWNGQYMIFGDGSNNPLLSLDVIAHEFSHGVDQYTAGLIYQNESGALDESFADISGACVKEFGIPDSADWYIGAGNWIIRNMANPNEYDHPDTYLGYYWYEGDQDNGGVHSNSGVQNFWFYLLSDGGSGTNDIGNEFDVAGIGIDDASAIAYRNHAHYLTPNSGYADARVGAILAAEDLFGSCSEEVLQTVKAWHAVGLGTEGPTVDMQMVSVELPEEACDLNDNETVDVSFRYNSDGCGEFLSAGTTFSYAYQINGGDVITEEYTLLEDVYGGDTINTVIEGVDFSDFGQFEMDTWVNLDDDALYFNDTIYAKETVHIIELYDEEVIDFEDIILSPDSFRVFKGYRAEAKISSSADNTGSKGFKMTGDNVNIDAIEWPEDESENFTLNPQYNSSICFCVNTLGWENVRLSFDLKQLHSEYWIELFGEDRPELSSSLRILIDGVQIGDQYHPTTYEDDPYLTHIVNLDEFADMQFNLCFQNKGFIPFGESPIPGDRGDNSYLDHIQFIDDASVGLSESELRNFSVYPNPTDGLVKVKLHKELKDFDIKVIDAIGKVIIHENGSIHSGNEFLIDLQAYERGVYIIQLQNGEQSFYQRLVLQ